MKKRSSKKASPPKKKKKAKISAPSLPLPQMVDRVVLVSTIPKVAWKEVLDPHFYYASDPDTGGMYGIRTDSSASPEQLDQVLAIALSSGKAARPQNGQIVAIPYSALAR